MLLSGIIHAQSVSSMGNNNIVLLNARVLFQLVTTMEN